MRLRLRVLRPDPPAHGRRCDAGPRSPRCLRHRRPGEAIIMRPAFAEAHAPTDRGPRSTFTQRNGERDSSVSTDATVDTIAVDAALLDPLGHRELVKTI